jgi:RNA polymerase sigma-70 factor (ECF subfamily)
MAVVTTSAAGIDNQLELHRRALTGYCYRMLGSPFEAEDAVQETLLRAWRGYERFEGRSQFRSWLYRIATNVCLDMISARGRRALPMDLGPASPPDPALIRERPEAEWITPIPDAMMAGDAGGDPADVALARETIRLAFVAALQHLPARQRAALILCEVLRWRASEVAELLDTSVASVNSALQRARATLEAAGADRSFGGAELDADKRRLLEQYVSAFERYDMAELTTLIREDAIQSMPPIDLWLSGRENILAWWAGPGIGCRGSRVLPAGSANGTVALAQYRVAASGEGQDAWALQVLELAGGGIAEMTFFLDVAQVFPLFGLPLHV